MKCSKDMFTRWKKYCRLRAAELNTHVDNITRPVAWNIAHQLDIPKEAYHVGMNDNHIETALKRIFRNAF